MGIFERISEVWACNLVNYKDTDNWPLYVSVLHVHLSEVLYKMKNLYLVITDSCFSCSYIFYPIWH